MTNTTDIGSMFDGRYRIDGKLGAGGFASVYRATDMRSDRQVALKVLEPGPDGGYDRETRLRFEREAAVLANLTSPHTVSLLSHQESADGQLYLTFELLSGEDLNERLEREGTIDVDLAIRLLRQVLSALHEAHRAGVLHRDIKPENIRLIPDADSPRAVLIDFGIARATEDGSPALTATGELIGTPRYMSPEQLTSRPLSPASDIYSLGVVLLELLLGRDAMHGGRWSDQLNRLHQGHVFDLAGLEHHGADLLAIISRMTNRDPSRRYRSAQAVLRALDDIERDPTIGGRDPVPANTPSSRAPIAIVAAVLIAIGLAVVLMLSSRDDPPMDPTRLPSALTKAPPSQPPRRSAAVVDVGVDGGATDAATRVATDALTRVATDALTRVATDAFGEGCHVETRHRNLSTLPIGDGVDTYVPSSYDPRRRHPVVVLLHDEGQTSHQLLAGGGFIEAAESHRFVVIAPSGGSGLLPVAVSAWSGGDDEVLRLRHIVSLAQTYLCLDPERVFVIGHGAGGPIAYRLACSDQTWIAGVASHEYARGSRRLLCGSDGDRRPSRPFLLVLGTKDSVKPVDGGPGCRPESVKLSHAEQFDLWTQRNRCEASPQVLELDGADCQRWACEVPFEACQTDGGADWPGVAKLRLKDDCDRGPPTSFAVADYMFGFFERVSR